MLQYAQIFDPQPCYCANHHMYKYIGKHAVSGDFVWIPFTYLPPKDKYHIYRYLPANYIAYIVYLHTIFLGDTGPCRLCLIRGCHMFWTHSHPSCIARESEEGQRVSVTWVSWAVATEGASHNKWFGQSKVAAFAFRIFQMIESQVPATLCF